MVGMFLILDQIGADFLQCILTFRRGKIIDFPPKLLLMMPKTYLKFSMLMGIIELNETFLCIHSLLSPLNSLWLREIKDSISKLEIL